VVDAGEHALRLAGAVTPRVTPHGEWCDGGGRRSVAAW
jgi:hypothetical protein